MPWKSTKSKVSRTKSYSTMNLHCIVLDIYYSIMDGKYATLDLIYDFVYLIATHKTYVYAIEMEHKSTLM